MGGGRYRASTSAQADARPHSCLRRNDERGGAGTTMDEMRGVAAAGSCLRRNDERGGAGTTMDEMRGVAAAGSCLRRNDEREAQE